MKKTILIVILIVLVIGVCTAAYFMLNPPVEDLTAYEDITDFDGTDAEPVSDETIVNNIKDALRKEYQKEVDNFDEIFQFAVLNNKIYKVTTSDKEGFETSYYLALLRYNNEENQEIFDTAVLDDMYKFIDRMDGLYNTYNELYIRMNKNQIIKMRCTPTQSPATYFSMVQFTGKKLINKSTKDLDMVQDYIDEKQKYLDEGDIESLAQITLGSNNLNFYYHEEEYFTQLTQILELADQKAKEAAANGEYDKASIYYSGTLDDIYNLFGCNNVYEITSETLDQIDQNPYLPDKDTFVNVLYSYADVMSHSEKRMESGAQLTALLNQIAPR